MSTPKMQKVENNLMPLIARQTNQEDSLIAIEGPVVGAFSTETGHRYLVIEVWTPWGQQEVIADWDECTVENKKFN